ncbi:MAG: hypothetical protein WHS86_01760 [Desulfosoma sp.]
MGTWHAVCLIAFALLLMTLARIRVFPHNQPKTDLIVGLLNSLSAGSISAGKSRCVSMGLGGADNG